MTTVLAEPNDLVVQSGDDIEVIADGPAPRTRSRIAIALLVILFAEVLARIIGPAGPEPLVWRDTIVALKVEQMEQSGPVDVVIAGTSMMMQGINPESLDTATYNSAIDAAVPAVQQHWLTSVVSPNLNPDVIVWGLAPLDLNDSADHPWVDSYFAAPAVRPGLMGDADRLGRALSALVRYRTEFREPGEFIEGMRSAADWRPSDITPSGFRNVFDQTPTTQHRNETAAFFDGYGSTADADIVAATITELQSQGITVVLAELAIPPRTIDLLPRGEADLAQFRSQLASLAESSGAELIDLRAGLDSDDLFTDYTHVTAQGATIMTETLRSELERLGLAS